MKFLASLLLLALQFYVVESAHPQRLVNDFLEDGTPIWRYVDLPPLEQVLDPKLEIEECGPNGHRDLQSDHLVCPVDDRSALLAPVAVTVEELQDQDISPGILYNEIALMSEVFGHTQIGGVRRGNVSLDPVLGEEIPR